MSRPNHPTATSIATRGELVHVDIKKLGHISVLGAGHRVLGHRGSQFSRRVHGRMTRLTGYEYLHVMIDDHSRLAYAEVLDDLTASARSHSVGTLSAGLLSAGCASGR